MAAPIGQQAALIALQMCRENPGLRANIANILADLLAAVNRAIKHAIEEFSNWMTTARETLVTSVEWLCQKLSDFWRWLCSGRIVAAYPEQADPHVPTNTTTPRERQNRMTRLFRRIVGHVCLDQTEQAQEAIRELLDESTEEERTNAIRNLEIGIDEKKLSEILIPADARVGMRQRETVHA